MSVKMRYSLVRHYQRPSLWEDRWTAKQTEQASTWNTNVRTIPATVDPKDSPLALSRRSTSPLDRSRQLQIFVDTLQLTQVDAASAIRLRLVPTNSGLGR